MRLPGKRIVALEITPSRVTLAEVEAGRRPRLYAWATVEGPFADALAMVRRIGEALEAGSFTARRAYVALSVPVEHRHLSLPPLSRRELRRVVEREVRREATIPPAERILDFAVVGETIERGDVRKKEVLLAVASEREIERYVGMLEEVGLTPWLVTSLPLALMAAVELQDRGEGPVVVAHLQGTFLEIIVAEGGILQLNREITLPALPGGEGVESWEGVVTEINRSLLYLHYFRQRFERREAQRILLTGNSADLIGLQEALAREPTLRAEVFDPKGRVELLAPPGEGPAWRAALPSLAAPLGLASRRPEVQLNLIPRRVEERKWGAVRRVAFGAVTAGTVILGSLSLFALTRGEQFLRQALEAQLKTWSTLEQQLREVEEVERQRALHQARFNLLEGASFNGPMWTGVLRGISLQAPPELLLHTLTLEVDGGGYRIVLRGQVISRSAYQAQVAFNRFYEGLQRSPFLATVTLLQPLKVSPKVAVKTAVPPPAGRSRLEFSLALTPDGLLRG
ncbi:MAG: hypothetical protein ACE5I9_05860 [Candidatus Methylomirabilales bacterium]